MTYVIIAVALVALAAILAFVFNNLGIWEGLTGNSSSFIGLFVFGLAGAIVGEVVGFMGAESTAVADGRPTRIA